MKSKVLFYAVAICMVVSAHSALGEPVTGSFTAISACDAYKSFDKATNPGLMKLTPGTEYEAVEVNNKEMDWVRVRIDGIADPLRWVAGQCGTRKITPIEADLAMAKKAKNCSTPNQYDSNVLALTWQPGFCEHVRYNGVKPECDALKDGSLVIEHLTIHGLWPNKKECGTRYGNCGGPQLDLEEETITRIGPWMPNFLYEKTFGSYEWSKHGTCQERSDDDYFLTVMNLAQAVDSSEIGTFIREKVGGKMSVRDFFDKIRDAHGQDVADRVMLICAKGEYLQEIRVNLPKEISVDPDLAKITQGARKMGSRTDKCDSDTIFVESSGEGRPDCPPAMPKPSAARP